MDAEQLSATSVTLRLRTLGVSTGHGGGLGGQKGVQIHDLRPTPTVGCPLGGEWIMETNADTERKR